jgi:hypothetical protein
MQILYSLTSAISILADTWEGCKENRQNSVTRALTKTPVGWLAVERYSKRHLVAQVRIANGLHGTFKFSEILGSTSYCYQAIARFQSPNDPFQDVQVVETSYFMYEAFPPRRVVDHVSQVPVDAAI